MMTAHSLYAAFTLFALVGWLTLFASVLGGPESLRETVAQRLVPGLLAVAYLILFIGFWGDAPGGFASLEALQSLFTSPWLTLVAWLHYLAGDLVIGSHIARWAGQRGWRPGATLALLALTMIALPVGLIAFEIARLINRTRAARA